MLNIDMIIIVMILIFLISFLIYKKIIRSSLRGEREALSKRFGTSIITGPMVFEGEPIIFSEMLGENKNLIGLGAGLYLFEYHFNLMSSGAGSLQASINMVIDINNKKVHEEAYISDRVFSQYPSVYPIAIKGYQCLNSNDATLNLLIKNNMSLLLGGWGAIYIPNNGKICDVDLFLEKIKEVNS